MVSICHYESPLGGVLLAADEIGLTGLWFDGQKYFARGRPADRVERETPALLEAKRWIDAVVNDTEVYTKPEEAIVVTRILEAIYESAKTGKPVYFD